MPGPEVQNYLWTKFAKNKEPGAKRESLQSYILTPFLSILAFFLTFWREDKSQDFREEERLVKLRSLGYFSCVPREKLKSPVAELVGLMTCTCSHGTLLSQRWMSDW